MSTFATASNTRIYPGLIFCAVLSLVAMLLSNQPHWPTHDVSALTLAILIGLVLGNSLPDHLTQGLSQGIAFAKHYFLRLGIILYGFRLTFQDIGYLGWSGVLIDAVVLLSTFALTVILGLRWLKMEKNTVLLMGVGSSICGAAAVLAAEPVVKARASETTIAISTVVVFGTLGIFAYPALYSLSSYLPFVPNNDTSFGIWAGSTIHEVAQVVAVGSTISPEAADTAVIAKMVRVMMLAPFLVLLALGLTRPWAKQHNTQGKNNKFTPSSIPWFAFIFIAIIALNSMITLPETTLNSINQFDTFLLAMAMMALGLTTDIKAVRTAGIKPLILGAIIFAWLIIGGGFINHWLS